MNSPQNEELILNIKFNSTLICFSQYNTVNQGLATLAFFGVGVNLVLFLTRVLQQNNADAANSVSKWTGTVYIFSLVGAFLSDSYWGRYKTCAIFQIIFVIVSTILNLKDFCLSNGDIIFFFFSSTAFSSPFFITGTGFTFHNITAVPDQTKRLWG